VRAAALVIIAAICAGCGGSSSSQTAAGTPAQLAAEAETARHAVLQADDVPTGYKPVTHGAFGPQLSDAAERALLTCAGLPRDFVDPDDDVPRADSPDFTYGRFAGGPAQRIASSVRLFRSSEEVRAALARVDRDDAVQCFAPMFRAGFAKGLAGRPGVTTSDFAVRPLSLGGIGDQSAAFQAIATMHTRGGPVQQDLDLYFVRAGRALVTMYAAGFDSPSDQRLTEFLLSTIASRLGDAR
jgi:hypothetical protein